MVKDKTSPDDSIDMFDGWSLGEGMVVADRYVVLRLIGVGGMGAVYAAQDKVLGRKVALKVIRSDGLQDAARRREHLRREARSMAKVRHPNVITVYDVGEADGHVYISMAYLDGVQLDLWLTGRDESGEPPPGPSAVLDAFSQAGEGLAAAQEAGLIHLDFKPSNVFRERGAGQIVVLDFGLARVFDLRPGVSAPTEGSADARSSAVVGTPKYMAPEQWLGAPEAASDQFAFCVALYDALWRQHPFGDAYGVIARASSVLESEPRDPPSTKDVPVHVWPALRRGMARDPRQRFASIRELLNALEPFNTQSRQR